MLMLVIIISGLRSDSRMNQAVVTMMITIIGTISHKFTHDILHPCWKCRQTADEIGGQDGSLIFVGEDIAQPAHDTTSVNRVGQLVMQPVQRLDDPHRRTVRPEQLARGGRSEGYGLFAECDRAQARVCMHDDLTGHRITETEIIGRGHAIHQHAGLVSPRDSLDHAPVVRNRHVAREPVETRPIIKAPIKATDVRGQGKAL